MLVLFGHQFGQPTGGTGHRIAEKRGGLLATNSSRCRLGSASSRKMRARFRGRWLDCGHFQLFQTIAVFPHSALILRYNSLIERTPSPVRLQLSPSIEVTLIASGIQRLRGMRDQTEKFADLLQSGITVSNQILVPDLEHTAQVRAVLRKEAMAMQPVLHQRIHAAVRPLRR